MIGKEREKLSNYWFRASQYTAEEEIQADADKYGDDRRSPIIERAEAKALTEHLIPRTYYCNTPIKVDCRERA